MASHLGLCPGGPRPISAVGCSASPPTPSPPRRRKSRRRVKLWQVATARGHFDRPVEGHPLDADFDRLDWPVVRDAIAQLDEREQTIVSLRFFADCSHEEIADVVEANVGAVRTALSRAHWHGCGKSWSRWARPSKPAGRPFWI